MKLIIARTNHEVDAVFRQELKAWQDPYSSYDEANARRNLARNVALRVFSDETTPPERLAGLEPVDPPIEFAYLDVLENHKKGYKKEARRILKKLG